MIKEDYAKLILRYGIAFSFIYAGVAAYFSPENWIGFIPFFLREILPGNILLNIHSSFNVLLGLWLLSGKKVYYSSIVSAIALFTIIIFNFSSLDIIFRDITILLGAVALAILSKNVKKKVKQS